MGYVFKAYTLQKDYKQYLRVECLEYNHPHIVSKAFATNKKFLEVNIVAIQDDV